MFSANENLVLRQHKRRIVNKVESTIPEHALDMGTTVMVMQVSCKAPGCVPLETAVIIVFPKVDSQELIPGLPESGTGGSFKTKILKPMADVTDDDVLEALPPAFEGGRRTMEKLCLAARDVMLAQITQLFGEEPESVQDRKDMAAYLQICLRQYIDNGCQAPDYGKPFLSDSTSSNDSQEREETVQSQQATTEQHSKGNFVIRRSANDNTFIPIKSNKLSVGNAGNSVNTQTSNTTSGAFFADTAMAMPVLPSTSTTQLTPTTTTQAKQCPISSMQHGIPTNLLNRQHAPGIRQSGCPCCDPDDPTVAMDAAMNL